MGLEGVEIILGVEAMFGIEVPGHIAITTSTPRQLIDYVFSCVPTATAEHCQTQRLFYQVRRGFRSVVPETTRSFSLNTEISAITEKKAWPLVWSEVRAAAGDSTWPQRVPYPGMWKNGPWSVRQLVLLLSRELPLPERNTPWTREQVANGVRRVIYDVTGEDDFHEDDRFKEELNIS